MDLDGIHSADELYATIAKVYGEEAAKKFAPRSAQDGYHYWYDAKTKRVELAKYSELQGIIDRTADFSTGAVESGIALMSAVAIDAPALDYTPFAVGDLRSVVNNRFYLIDKMADGIVNDLNSLDTCTSATFNTVVDKFVNGSYENNSENALAQDILKNLGTTAIANDNGIFAYNKEGVTNLYVPEGTEKISDNVTVYNSEQTEITLSGVTSVVLPSTIKNIQSYSMLGFDANATITVNTDEDNLDEIFAAESTDCVIQLPSGDSYAVEGNSIVKLGVDADGNPTKTTIATDLEYTIPVKVMNLTPIQTNKINLVSQLDGTDNLYVAVDYTGDITLSVFEFLDKDGNKLDLEGEDSWEVKSGNLTYEGGKFKVTGFADADDAYVGEITVSVQTLTKTIKVYGVKALNVTVDTSDNAHLNIDYEAKGEDPNKVTDVTITMSYNPTADNTFNFTPSLVHNHEGTSIVLDNQPTVTDSEEKMSYSYDTTTSKGTLKLPANTFEGKATTTLTVSYGTVESDVTYKVNLINKLDDTFAIADYVTTQTYKSLTKYYVGNAGTFKLSYLFKAIKTIPSDQKIVVEVYNGQAKVGGYEFTGLDGLLDLSKTELSGLVGKDITIKIGLKNSPDREEITVGFVAATNVTADTVSSMPSSTTSDIVLLSDINLTSAKTLRKVYGNLHKINASTYQASTNNYWNALITLYGQMDDTVLVGPTYNAVQYYAYADIDPGRTDNTNTKAWDGVKLVSSASTITNSYVYGFRAPVSVVASNGNATSPSTVRIENTTIEGGAMANMHIGSVGNLILNNVITVQDYNGYSATVGSGTIYGLGVYFDDYCRGTVTLSGNTQMYNWISKTEGNKLTTTLYLTYKIKDVISKIVDVANTGGYLHNTSYVNTGFIQDGGTAVNTITSNDTYNGIDYSGIGKITLGTFVKTSYAAWSIPSCTGTCTHGANAYLPTGWSHQNTNHSSNYLSGRVAAPTTN